MNNPTTWTVRIDNWNPVRVNQLIGCHWGVVAKRKKADLKMMAHYLRHIPKAAQKRIVGLKIILGKRQRGFDPDAPWKSVLDSLVTLGLLVDDRKEWVELAPVQYERGSDGKPATIITITESGG